MQETTKSWPLNFEEVEGLKKLGFKVISPSISQVKTWGEVMYREYEMDIAGSTNVFQLTMQKGHPSISICLTDIATTHEIFRYTGKYDIDVIKMMMALNVLNIAKS